MKRFFFSALQIFALFSLTSCMSGDRLDTIDQRSSVNAAKIDDVYPKVKEMVVKILILESKISDLEAKNNVQSAVIDRLEWCLYYDICPDEADDE